MSALQVPATGPAQAQPVRMERATGTVRVAFKAVAGRTRLADLWQDGTAKAKFPNVAPGDPPEAVLLNTGGGMTGGDVYGAEVHLAEGTSAVTTTQANEKVYRAMGAEPARVSNRVRLEAGARLDWLPQETILFDGARLDRRFEADVAADAHLLLVEAAVFGRTARGEHVHVGALFDGFRISRAGRLVFADACKVNGAVADTLARPAVARGAGAIATVIMVAPGAEALVETAREAMAEPAGEMGVSGWNGCLVARFVSVDGRALRRDLVTFLGHIRHRALPRVWTT